MYHNHKIRTLSKKAIDQKGEIGSLMEKNNQILTDDIQSKIYMIRGAQVMLDMDLGELNGVETRILNQAVKRNKNRFPEQFCFQLSNKEITNLKSQFVISSEKLEVRNWLKIT